MDEDKSIKTFLKIVGIAALVAIPVVFLVKKLRADEGESLSGEDGNIFSEDFSE